MGLPTPGTNKLSILRAIEDGWQAFCRAPWPFVLFQVLVLVIMAPFIGLIASAFLHLALGAPALLHPVATKIGLVVGIVGNVVISLWAAVGLTRGAWISLEGHKPSFSSFTRWDSDASGRLFGSSLLLTIVLAVVGAVAWAIGFGLGRVNAVLFWIPVIAFAIFKIWLVVTQQFLVPMSLYGTRRPVETLQAGIDGVNPSWWTVVWFVIVESVVAGVAWLFNAGGLLVLAPVLICVSTAAYRQLFGSQDHTGIMSNN
ncbi:hypothetical protein [Synechococcus sp. LTW-G]